MAQIKPKQLKMKDGRSFTIRNIAIDDAQALIDFVYNFEAEYEFRLREKAEMNLTLEKK